MVSVPGKEVLPREGEEQEPEADMQEAEEDKQEAEEDKQEDEEDKQEVEEDKTKADEDKQEDGEATENQSAEGGGADVSAEGKAEGVDDRDLYDEHDDDDDEEEEEEDPPQGQTENDKLAESSPSGAVAQKDGDDKHDKVDKPNKVARGNGGNLSGFGRRWPSFYSNDEEGKGTAGSSTSFNLDWQINMVPDSRNSMDLDPFGCLDADDNGLNGSGNDADAEEKEKEGRPQQPGNDHKASLGSVGLAEKGVGKGKKGKAAAKAKAKDEVKRIVLKYCYICGRDTDDWSGNKAECRPCMNDKEAAERDARNQGEKAFFDTIKKDKALLANFVRDWRASCGPSKGPGHRRGGFKIAEYKTTIFSSIGERDATKLSMKTEQEFEEHFLRKGMPKDWGRQEFRKRLAQPTQWRSGIDPDCGLPTVQLHGSVETERYTDKGRMDSVELHCASKKNPKAQEITSMIGGLGEDLREIDKKELGACDSD